MWWRDAVVYQVYVRSFADTDGDGLGDTDGDGLGDTDGDGLGRDGGPPNGWTSAFGGPAWTRDDRSGEWYLHFFAPQQPNLNWHNEAVRRDFEDVLRFWLDRGVDGFRIDVAQGLFKDAELRDMDEPDPVPWWADWHTAMNQADLHPLYRRWREIVDAYPGDRVLVGEIVLRDHEALARYVRSDELHLAFNLALFHDGWDADALATTIDRTLAAFHAVDATRHRAGCSRTTTRRGCRRGTAVAVAAGVAPAPRRCCCLALPGTAFVGAHHRLVVRGGQLMERLGVLLPELEEAGAPRRNRHGIEQRHAPEAPVFEEERAQGDGPGRSRARRRRDRPAPSGRAGSRRCGSVRPATCPARRPAR